jgi:hypothetical protein
MAEDLDNVNLRFSQYSNILEQYRSNMFMMEHRTNLVIRMLEEKGIFAKNEFDTRWPLYLKNDVGVPGQDGMMQGSLKITFFEQGVQK